MKNNEISTSKSFKDPGKILEKLITRINYWAYSTNFLNNQHGFTPQRTIHVAMAVKNTDVGLNADVIILRSLDIQTAFDAAWWPNIHKSLQDYGCPKNLFYLVKSYLNQRCQIDK